MKDIEQALQAGRELEAPAELAAKVKGAVDAELAAAGAAGVGSGVVTTSALSSSTWIAAAVIAVVLGAVVVGPFFFSESETPSTPENAGVLMGQESAVDGVSASSEVAVSTQAAVVTTADVDAAGTAEGAEVVSATGGAIYGIVTDPWGQPVPDARVVVRQGSASNHVLTGPDGSYEIALGSVVAGVWRTSALAAMEAEFKVQQQFDAWKASNGAVATDMTRDRLARTSRRAAVAAESAVESSSEEQPPVVEVTYEEVQGRQPQNRFSFSAAPHVRGVERELVTQELNAAAAAQLRITYEMAREEAVAHEGGTIEVQQWAQDAVAAPTLSGGEFTRYTVSVTAPNLRLLEVETLLLASHERVKADLRLEEAESLEGVVLDAAGAPVVGANVAIAASLERVLQEERSRTSDDAGAFAFMALPAGTHVIRITAPEFQPVERIVHTGGEPLVIEMDAAAVLEVVVSDEVGGLQRQVTAEVLREGRVIDRVHSDRNGKALFDNLTPGVVSLRIFGRNSSIPAFVDELVLVGGETESLEVQLPGRVEVEGFLEWPDRSGDGEGERGKCLVLAFAPEFPGNAPRAWSEKDGTFRFEGGLLPGQYTLGVATNRGGAWGLRMLEEFVVRPREGTQVVRVSFVETVSARLEFKVRNAAGEPIAASVSMARERTGSRATRSADKEGSYSIDLHPDRFDITVHEAGYEPQLFQGVVLKSGDVRTFDVTLHPVAQLVGLDLLQGDSRVIMRGSLRVRSVLELLDEVAPQRVAVTPELEDSLILDQPLNQGGSIDQIVVALVENLALTWQVDAGQLVLGMPQPTSR